jgi:hypothetical protein
MRGSVGCFAKCDTSRIGTTLEMVSRAAGSPRFRRSPSLCLTPRGARWLFAAYSSHLDALVERSGAALRTIATLMTAFASASNASSAIRAAVFCTLIPGFKPQLAIEVGDSSTAGDAR